MAGELPPFRQRLLEKICQFEYVLFIVLSFQIVLLLLTLLSLFFAQDLDPDTQMIINLNAILLGSLLIATVILIRVCSRFEKGEKILLPSRREE